jgi:Helix-turn-helix domain
MTDMLPDQARPDGRDHETGTDLATLTDQQVRMSLAPLATVTSLLMEALGNERGSPRAWHEPVRSALDPADQALFGPLLGTKAAFIPDCLVPRPESFAPTFSEELERVASTSADELLEDLVADGLLDTAGSPIARAPRKWLGAYTTCLERAWTGIRPLWDRARPLMESEVDRVGGALARGAFDVLFNQLSPRVRVKNARWHLQHREAPATIAPGMVLTPLVGGSKALFIVGWDDAVHELAYPLPGARRLGDVRADAANGENGDALKALLGAPRADLLRRLDRSVTAGSLAEAMLYVPSAISHHLLALERAGLVQRERSGRHVLVHRTVRGTALVNLYDL